MLVLGFMFAILVPLLALYARTQAETTNAFADAQTIRLGNTLRDVAERVYFAGSPAQETLTVTVPRGIARAQIEEYDQVYTLGPPSEEYTIRITGLAPLNGTLPARAGTYRVVVTATNGTAYVRIP
jgi:Flp pilus assembly protein TadG